MKLETFFTPFRLFLILAVCGFIVYFNGLSHPQIIDDHVFFDEMGVNPKNLPIHFIPDKAKVLKVEGAPTEAYYRPFALIIPRVFYMIGGGKAFFIHLCNLLLWVTAAWMTTRMVGLISANMRLGLISGLLIMIHPINTIIVNFKTAGIFAFEAIMMLISLRLILKNKPTWFDQFIIILCFISALFCHENAFGLPLFALIMVRFALNKTWAESLWRTKVIWVTAGLYFLLRLQWASLDVNIFSKYAGYKMSIDQFLASWFYFQAWYMSRIVVPEGVVISILRPAVTEHTWSIITLGVGVWATAFWAVLRFLKNNIWGFIALGWLAVGFAMCAAGIMTQGHLLIFEPHWLVFSSIGLFILIAQIIVLCLDSKKKNITMAVCAGFVCMWLFYGWKYNNLWNNEINYSQYWLKQSPLFRPIHLYIARSYFAQGQLDMAAQHYVKALTGTYADYLIYANLGAIALFKEDYETARRCLEKTIEIEPKARTALNSLAVVYVRLGDLAKAEEYFKRSAAANPFDTTAQKNLEYFYRYQEQRKSDPNKPPVPLVLSH